jgi:hypothetical protein
VIEAATDVGNVWGESTVIVAGDRITNIARYGAKPLALVSTSDDRGRTWTPARPSNLSMSDKTPGVSDKNADFSDPCAIEHEGRLYVGYTHKSHMANELAVIPVAALKAD